MGPSSPRMGGKSKRSKTCQNRNSTTESREQTANTSTQHKRAKQTNPIRLGSSSRKTPAARAVCKPTTSVRRPVPPGPGDQNGKTSAANLATPPRAGSRSPTQSSSPGARKFKEQGSLPGVQGQLRPVLIRGCMGPRGNAPPPCATGLRPTSHPPTPRTAQLPRGLGAPSRTPCPPARHRPSSGLHGPEGLRDPPPIPPPRRPAAGT
jgi:hypothetical protein